MNIIGPFAAITAITCDDQDEPLNGDTAAFAIISARRSSLYASSSTPWNFWARLDSHGIDRWHPSQPSYFVGTGAGQDGLSIPAPGGGFWSLAGSGAYRVDPTVEPKLTVLPLKIPTEFNFNLWHVGYQLTAHPATETTVIVNCAHIRDTLVKATNAVGMQVFMAGLTGGFVLETRLFVMEGGVTPIFSFENEHGRVTLNGTMGEPRPPLEFPPQLATALTTGI